MLIWASGLRGNDGVCVGARELMPRWHSRLAGSSFFVASATLVTVGVIEEHQLESWSFFRVQVPNDSGSAFWRVRDP